MIPKDVLVVDDEPLMRDALELSLRPEFRVFKAGSGREALEIAKKRTFPLVVLDLRMDGLDGIATLKRLRRHNQSQKVVILTAHQSMETAIEAVNSGAHSYLTKPCDFRELRNVLSEAHSRYLAEQERMEACRERLLELHDDFFSVLCHEFNTPLNGIIGFASILQEELKDEDMANMAARIEESGTDLHKVFMEILDYINSKVPTDRETSTTFSGLELSILLAERRDSLDIDYKLCGSFWNSHRRLVGPLHSISAILSKLIAASGSSQRAPVQVEAMLDGEQLVFELSNLEIESRLSEVDDIGSIFKPYVPESLSCRSYQTGIGLHLATCQNLAETAGISLEARRSAEHGIRIIASLRVEFDTD